MLNYLTNFIKDIITPKKCYSCNKEGYFLCHSCYEKIDKFYSTCYVCKKSSNNFQIHRNCKKNIYFNNLFIAFHYNNIYIKKLIKDGKFYNKKDIFEDFGNFLYNKFIKKIENKNDYIIASVPLHIFKKFKRGYNQSEILSRIISEKSDIPYIKNLVYKVKNTGQQSLYSRQERLTNLTNSFKINQKQLVKIDNIKEKIIILVDDVVSTGSTLNEVSNILIKSGFTNIISLAIASD